MKKMKDIKLIELTNPEDFDNLEWAEISVLKGKSAFLFYKLITAKGCVNAYGKNASAAKTVFEEKFGGGAKWSNESISCAYKS